MRTRACPIVLKATANRLLNFSSCMSLCSRVHHRAAMRKRRSLLLVLSHMRSYSSVLSHVLGSHPEIDGYCETHIRYRLSLDVHRLGWKVRALTGEPLSGRFVLDKVLHN